MEIGRLEILAATFCDHRDLYKLVVFDSGVRTDVYSLDVYRDNNYVHVHVFTKKKIERYLRRLS